MQGAAVGAVLAQLAPQTGDALDTIDTAATTAAGALAMLPGPIGLAGKAALALKAVLDIASHDVDTRNDAEAKRKLGTRATEERTAALIGTGKREMRQFGPADWRSVEVGSNANDHDRRVAAQSMMRELYEGGAGSTVAGRVSFDPTRARQILEQNNPGAQGGEIDRLLAAAAAARDLLNSDAVRSGDFVREIDPKNALPAPERGIDEQRWKDTFDPEMKAPVEPSYGKQVIEVILAPKPGFDFFTFVTNQISLRRKGSR